MEIGRGTPKELPPQTKINKAQIKTKGMSCKRGPKYNGVLQLFEKKFCIVLGNALAKSKHTAMSPLKTVILPYRYLFTVCLTVCNGENRFCVFPQSTALIPPTHPSLGPHSVSCLPYVFSITLLHGASLASNLHDHLNRRAQFLSMPSSPFHRKS